MDEKLLTAIQGLIREGDELHAQHVADLEKSIAGVQEVLRMLATQAMTLADIKAPTNPADRATVEAVVDQARKVMECLKPPSN